MMKQLTKAGHFLFGFGLVALGVHQILLKDFRSEILAPFPSWLHTFIAFPILAGVALIFCGVIISAVLKTSLSFKKNTCLYLAFCFLVIIITCHLPYILIISPDKVTRIDVWFGAGEELAYCGGALVMAGSFSASNNTDKGKNPLILWMEKLIPLGRIFFSILIILFGSAHFIFTDVVADMVPKFFGSQLFWTYFAGAALIASSIAIILRIWVKTVALLLAIMLLLFFIFFHIPDAIANPYTAMGSEIVRAIVALLFCGIALVISTSAIQQKKIAA